MAVDNVVARELYLRDHQYKPEHWQWGRDYGKDILSDLNMLAHARGTDALTRDALQRAYVEISRLRKRDQTERLSEALTASNTGPLPCEKCGGHGWLWWDELDRYDGPANETGSDDTRYSCDRCRGRGHRSCP